MKCNSCGNDLKVLNGGMKTEIDSTDIKMVHIHGCMNKHCKECMKEKDRTETIVDSFVEVIEEDTIPTAVIDVNINFVTEEEIPEETIEIPQEITETK